MRRPVLFVGDINVDFILGGLESHPVVDREICEFVGGVNARSTFADIQRFMGGNNERL